MKKSIRKAYKITSMALGAAGVVYLLLLTFPQALFAYSADHGKFKVYSREPIISDLEKVLDAAEAKLRTSPIYDGEEQRRIYLTGSFSMYTFLSHKAYNSFANSVPFIDNVFINKTDVPADLVIMNRAENNTRSLSGVIAHETAHLFIRKRYGTVSASLMPTWKNEGYCEYIAGDSTITLAEGIRRWRVQPADDTGYRYIKYHLMVKHLLETEKLTLDDLFTRSFDEKRIAEKTFAALE
jgi:hypothetical protein